MILLSLRFHQRVELRNKRHAVGPIRTAPTSDPHPILLSVEVLTKDGSRTLRLSATVAVEFAAAIVRHMREEQLLNDGERPATNGVKSAEL